MPYHIGVGGAWKLCNGAHVGVGGAWKRVQTMYIGVGGAWKKFYQYLTVTMPDQNANRSTVTPSNATATLSILNDGTWSATSIGGGTNTGTWLTAGAVADVEVFYSGTGDSPTGASLSTWLSCSTTRSWTLTETTDGAASKSFTGTLQFRAAAGGAILDTAACNITATVTV